MTKSEKELMQKLGREREILSREKRECVKILKEQESKYEKLGYKLHQVECRYQGLVVLQRKEENEKEKGGSQG